MIKQLFSPKIFSQNRLASSSRLLDARFNNKLLFISVKALYICENFFHHEIVTRTYYKF